MKPESKSALFYACLAFLGFGLLSGCADTKWPTWLTGEPDESVLNAPRPVGKPENKNDESYPLLSSVPEKPKDFSTIPQREKEISRLSREKAEADQIRASDQAAAAQEKEEPASPPDHPFVTPPEQ
jgi:hypothetical protein